MADGAERREARRFTMSLPLRVLPRNDTGKLPHDALLSLANNAMKRE